MILITIDELCGDSAASIASKTGDKVYNLNFDENIPFNEIDIMIIYGTEEDWELLDKLSDLKWIQVFQTVIVAAPLEKIKKRNILITNDRDIKRAPMSGYVISMIV